MMELLRDLWENPLTLAELAQVAGGIAVFIILIGGAAMALLMGQ